MAEAEIGVFGGSGFYSFLENAEEVRVSTPYGHPSDTIMVGEIAGRKVAFLPRHGRHHQFPPHFINYRANVWAMKQLGVSRILGPCAAGSLQPNIHPGDFVICDQFVDRTRGREDTFYHGPETTHISCADPYCAELAQLATQSAGELGIPVHSEGTVVVVQGPRFSTRAESKWFSSMGWHVVTMTQYPEAVLAAELEMCYVNVSLITDYDVGLADNPEIKAVSLEEVVRIFNANNDLLRKLLFAMIPKIPTDRVCRCATALDGARF